MTFQIGLLLVILTGAVVVFVSEKLRPDLVAILVMLCLGITQLVTTDEAFSGFSSPSVIMIIAVFVITGGLFRTGVSAVIGRSLVRVAGASELRMVLVVSLAAAGLSLFMNNIASASIIMPAIIEASRITRINPSKLLLPMAMATQLGGMATLFTTSNLVASGVLQNAGYRGFGMFDFLPVGGLAAAAGILYIVFVGRHLLPEHHPFEDARKLYRVREDLVGLYQLKERLHAAQVNPGSPLIGHSLAETGIGDRLGLTVIAIERDGVTHVSPSVREIIRPGDILLVEGRAERAARLEEQKIRISPAAGWNDALTADAFELLEVLVAPRSEVIGKTLKQSQFRAKYGLNVVALLQGERVYRTDVGNIVLRGGESLLVHGPRAKVNLLRLDPDWIVLRVSGIELPQRRRMWAALAVFAATLAAAAFSPWPVGAVMFVGALAMVLIGCLTMDEAYRAIDWRSVFLVACMLPVGIALGNTGTARMVGDAVISLLGGFGPLAVIAGLFVVSMAFTQIIPGGAAVPALMTPIAVAAAQTLHSDPRAFALVIAIAAGTSTLTPFAHPVNVLVMGPGGYRFRDYVRAGLPLVLITFVVVMLALPLFWNIGG